MGVVMSRFFTDAISPYSRFIFRTMHAVIPKLSKTAFTILKPVCISTMYRLIGSLCSFDAFHLSTAFLSVHSKDIILGVEGTSAKKKWKIRLISINSFEPLIMSCMEETLTSTSVMAMQSMIPDTRPRVFDTISS